MSERHSSESLLSFGLIITLLIVGFAFFCGEDMMKKHTVIPYLFLVSLGIFLIICLVIIGLEIHKEKNQNLTDEIRQNVELIQEKENITVDTSVGFIPQHFFYSFQDLKIITFKTNNIKISDYAFFGHKKLETVFLEKNSCKYIGKYAFSNCHRLENIKISFGIEEIDDNAFSDCYELSKIEFPNSIKELGKNIFENCLNLEHIDFLGSEDEWNSIKKEKDWNKNSSLRRIFLKNENRVISTIKD